MLDKILSREGRKYVYVISITVIALLTGYGLVSDAHAPLWGALALSIFSPTLALANLTPLPAGDETEDGEK